MPHGDPTSDIHLTLTACGVGLVLHTTDGRLPAIVHWGVALPAMDADQVVALVDAAVPVIGSNNPDVAPLLSVLPEHHTGWTGRPGLIGSRAGRAWSPAFRVESVLLDGAPVVGVVHAGAGSVEFRAVDPDGLLRLDLIVELLPTGLVRTRGDRDEPGRAAVLPRRADGGAARPRRRRRAARLRRPAQPGAGAAAQPRCAPGCTCARTARAAPAPTAPTSCTPGRPASGSRPDASTPCTRRSAATTSTTPSARPPASACSAAASCCSPARSGSPPARATPARGSTAPSATGSTRSPAASTRTCGRGRGRSRRSGR